MLVLTEDPNGQIDPTVVANAHAVEHWANEHALETLPGRIEALQKELGRLHEAMADPDLYARDPARFDKVSKAVDEKTTALSAAEDEWLALEMLREELEG